MPSDHTQHQSDQQQRQSQQLSRQRSRPPLDIAGYEARQFLGAGAYGEVWVAIDENTGRKVAIKFYTQRSSLDWSLLSREVEKLVFLSADRYVVQLLDVGWDSEPPYYVMEYVDGGSLQQLLDDTGPLAVGQAVETFRDVATGLLHAHGKGVLHCDLKPANILLDQDRKPRLADFGQSRLSHEQTPALGTLFFMAPEQADLKAVPDARWDVYALGALLYCMLTGNPPHRSEQLLSEIDSSPTLISRLEKYRAEIEKAPPASLHRQVPGVDRELGDIIDRCLQVDARRRFPNVQSVLTTLRERDQIKDRKPLLMLGLLGPLLFLLVLGIFGLSASRTSVQESDIMVRKWALNSSRFAAKYVSEAVARRIDNYFRLVQEQATNEELRAALKVVQQRPEMSEMLEQLADDNVPDPEKESIRAQFIAHPDRVKLQDHITQLIREDHANVASWFVTDANGIHLASHFTEIEGQPEPNSTVGVDYSWRTYFHGGNEDRLQTNDRSKPLPTTQLSPLFQSTATGTWKVAVSTPIPSEQKDEGAIGVVALTVELGRLGEEEALSPTEGLFVTLVDGRQGPSLGVVLQHPLFNKILALKGVLPGEFSSDKEYRVPEEVLADQEPGTVELYTDPMAKHALGKAYDRKWIAARQEVQLKQRDATGESVNTGLVVLVQENYDSAVQPVKQLGDALLRYVFIAFLLVLAGVIVLWYLVMRALRDPNETLRRSGGTTRQPSSIHSMETLELPDKLRESPGRSG